MTKYADGTEFSLAATVWGSRFLRLRRTVILRGSVAALRHRGGADVTCLIARRALALQANPARGVHSAF